MFIIGRVQSESVDTASIEIYSVNILAKSRPFIIITSIIHKNLG